MSTKHWKNINKFRLFTIVRFSLLTSLSLSIGETTLWTSREFLTAILQAGIAGFAYLQCPTIPTTSPKTEEK